MKNCDAFLPEDVLFHILLWLPVTSLFRFKSVCKSWLALITSPNFIDQHVNLNLWHGPTAMDDNTKLIVRNLSHSTDDTDRTGVKLSILSGDDFGIEAPMDCNLTGYSICRREIPLHMIVCNGVVCLYNFGYIDSDINPEEVYHSEELYPAEVYAIEASLWNPATKQQSFLPQSPCPLPKCYVDHRYVCCSLGFGFDVKTNSHKVVKLSIMVDYANVGKSRVEVYSVSSDSWRVVRALPVDVTYLVSEPTTPYKNETYCWLGRIGFPTVIENTPENLELFDHCIISFHFTNEVFEIIPLPDAHSVKISSGPQLAFLRDKLACINSVEYGEYEARSGCFEVWVLLEYGVKESWTKLYKVGPFFCALRLGLLKNDTFLLVIDRQLCMYDLLSQQMKNLPVRHRNYGKNIEVAEYRESLADVKRGNGAANTITTRGHE